MSEANRIRELYFEKGLHYAEIARRTNHDTDTVRKYVAMEEWTTKPKTQVTHGSKLDPYKKVIDEWLLDDKQSRRKQRHTATRVFDRLQKEHGYQGGYRLIAEYVKQRKTEIYDRANEFYLPLEHIPGEAQADFGEADFYERGVLVHGYYVNLSFPFSNASYFQLCKGADLLNFIEALMAIFRHIAGVPDKIWFDNDSVMVKKIRAGGERDLTAGFLRFKNHFLFTAAFCNPDSGHEKGHVEGKVGYHRRNFLVPVPHFDDRHEFNRQLLTLCDEDMGRPHYRKEIPIRELFAEDRAKLAPLPEKPFDASAWSMVRTNGYAQFTLDGRHTYSTLPQFAQAEVLVQQTVDAVVVHDREGREVIRHGRLYGEAKQESIQWLPYLTQLARRPMALKNTGIYGMLPESVQSCLETCGLKKKRDLLGVLADLTKEKDFGHAVQALETALALHRDDPDSIRAVFRRLTGLDILLDGKTAAANAPDLPGLAPDIEAYDGLLKGGGPH